MDDGHWECEIDYNNDGNVDWYNHYDDCMWDNNSMTHTGAQHGMITLC